MFQNGDSRWYLKLNRKKLLIHGDDSDDDDEDDEDILYLGHGKILYTSSQNFTLKCNSYKLQFCFGLSQSLIMLSL
jgi:hypothetical protein